MKQSPLAQVKEFNGIYRLTLSKKIKHQFLFPSKNKETKDDIKIVKEQLDQAVEELIYLYYEMETAILRDGFIPFETGQRLKILKAIIFLCKKMLSLPDIGEIVFPEEFIEEYTSLLQKANKAIEQVSSQVSILNKSGGE